MNYWVFIATDHKVRGKDYSGEATYIQRMEDKFWGIGEKTPNRKQLKKGDKVVYYIGQPVKAFAGTAILSSEYLKLTEEEKKGLSHGDPFYTSDYGVYLENIETWGKRKPIEGLAPSLSFIQNKEFWFAYFQGGVRMITEDDYRIIAEGIDTTLIERISRSKDLESEADFALEEHLEEFIYQNWDKIEWGTKLKLYKTEELNGRQYPAGPWSIDFVAINDNSNEFVVIELKRGKTSDAVVGQTLRYMSWVKENLAEPAQKVKGIIIAKDIDEALRYAVRGLNIGIKTYSVDFHLRSINTE